jgi:hypothetical protein
MNKAPLNTLRKLSTMALVSVLALGSGCGDGYFAEGGGAIHRDLDASLTGGTGVAELGLNQVPVEVEVDLESNCIIFDFSNVEGPGVLSTVDSDGFAFDVTELPSVLGVSIDPELTSANLSELGIRFNGTEIAIHFHDLAFDDTTFIKIDLRFAEAAAR